MSIRFKIILSLLLLTATCLGVYVLLAKSVFEKDKEVAIFESVSQTSNAQAFILKQDLDDVLAYATSLVTTWDPTTQGFSSAGQDLFFKKKNLIALGIYDRGRFPIFVTKNESINEKSILGKLSKEQPELVPFDDTGHVLITFPIRNDEGQIEKNLMVIANFRQQLDLLQFSEKTGGTFAAIGETVFSNLSTFPFQFAHKFIKAVPLQKNMGEQTAIEYVDGKEYLISTKDVQFGGLQIFSIVPKDLAFRGLSVLYKKSVNFSALVFFIVLGVSIIMTHTLLKNLDRLTNATAEVSRGHFDIRIGVESQDEFGLLASSFQKMSQEIKRLIIETKEKARMEGELKTAQAVQENLFPAPNYRTAEFELSGLYRPASECGGDWWYHFEHSTGVYILICDATGHGAPAALITAAAKATVNLMRKEPQLNLQKLASAFNYALYETARGNILMTGFILHIKHDLTVEYINASHEAPLIFTDEDIHFVIDPIGKRFGENLNTVYQSGKIENLKNKTMVLYTDGITGQTNKDGRAIGDKRFTKFINKLTKNKTSLEAINSSTFQMVDEFRKDQNQDDDLTIVSLRFTSQT